MLSIELGLMLLLFHAIYTVLHVKSVNKSLCLKMGLWGLVII